MRPFVYAPPGCFIMANVPKRLCARNSVERLHKVFMRAFSELNIFFGLGRIFLQDPTPTRPLHLTLICLKTLKSFLSTLGLLSRDYLSKSFLAIFFPVFSLTILFCNSLYWWFSIAILWSSLSWFTFWVFSRINLVVRLMFTLIFELLYGSLSGSLLVALSPCPSYCNSMVIFF